MVKCLLKCRKMKEKLPKSTKKYAFANIVPYFAKKVSSTFKIMC